MNGISFTQKHKTKKEAQVEEELEEGRLMGNKSSFGTFESLGRRQLQPLNHEDSKRGWDAVKPSHFSMDEHHHEQTPTRKLAQAAIPTDSR